MSEVGGIVPRGKRLPEAREVVGPRYFLTFEGWEDYLTALGAQLKWEVRP